MLSACNRFKTGPEGMCLAGWLRWYIYQANLKHVYDNKLTLLSFKCHFEKGFANEKIVSQHAWIYSTCVYVDILKY